MNYGLIILYALISISLLINANHHGRAKTGKDSFWSALLSAIITLVLVWWALGWQILP